MTAVKRPNRIGRDALMIVVGSAILAIIFNAFSANPLPLFYRPPVKIATADSVLFGGKNIQSDSARTERVPVIAPLHEQALRHYDSMKSASRKSQSSERQSHNAIVDAKKDSGYMVVSLEQVKRLLGEHRSVFVDGRNADEFEKGHIKGAMNIPYLDVDKYFEKMMTIPRDTIVVVYCHNPECPLGRDLADFMSQMGFSRLYLYDQGWDEWEKSGLPVDKSDGGGNQ